MLVKQKNGVFFLEFPKLAGLSGILHGVFTRKNGKSKGPFQSLNVSFGVGDNDQTVLENRKIISRCFNDNDLIFLDQIHGTRIIAYSKENGFYRVLDANDCFKDEYSETLSAQIDIYGIESERRFEADAIVTDIPGKLLVIQVADCQSVLIYDPVQKVAANVHSGWRGSINNIIGCTLKVMENSFGCRSRDIVAGIGPSLGPCCAEFVNYKNEIPEAFWKYKNDTHHFDFWSISRDQLCEAGVLLENVDLSRMCTKCDLERFFSYRGEGTTGRFAALIGLSRGH
jgi:purine-nucleoside/S-methyl-5'-thioadenosine phosphorylase / adenosine deaminase